MAKPLSYADALRVLGKDDGRITGWAEALAGAAGDLSGLPGLGALGEQVVSQGTDAVRGIRDRITGVSRLDRTQRIEAAHAVIMIVSFFEALEEELEKENPGFRFRDLQFTREEQVALATGGPVRDGYAGVISSLAEFPLSPPKPGADNPADILRAFVLLAEITEEFVTGLADAPAWPGSRGHATPGSRRLAELALAKYEARYLSLMADVPEFAAWATVSAQRAVRWEIHEEAAARQRQWAELTTGLASLGEQLQAMSSGSPVDRLRADLAARHRAVLGHRILATAEVPPGFTLPSLGEAYLNPHGRVATVQPDSLVATDEWWEQHPVLDDLQPALVGLLTSLRATRFPIVILGHPGAGKSILTQVLAARLPAEDFLPIRVELRSVPADAPIQDQIERGIRAAIGDRVSWPELARSANGALPVVMLDGFDELLQATGVNRSDYLEHVREFQEREAELGRPVAVIVTSRTVVADRTRFPDHTPVIRLEPLSEGQIGRLLGIWNAGNSGMLRSRGLRPLTRDHVLQYRELAEQPLLLVMLLIFDAADNALQRRGTDLGRAELYERLLTGFAEREVRKHASYLSPNALDQAIADELRGLQVVAMAMFARHKQTVTAEELEADLKKLLPNSGVRAQRDGFQGAISDADQLLARFFFTHESQAVQGTRQRSTYEFLHATFGEYLTARMVTGVLDDLVEDRRRAARRRYAAPPDDGLFYALTSFAALAGRDAVVEFTDDLLTQHFTEHPEERAEYRALLIELFQAALYPNPERSYSGYQPHRMPITQRVAVHTANLATLLALIAPEGVDIAELYPNSAQPWQEWRGTAGLWRAMHGDDWHGFLSTVRIRHQGYWDGPGRSVITRERRTPVNVGECVGFELYSGYSGTRHELAITNPYDITVPAEGVTSGLLRSMAMRAHGAVARTVLMLGPYLRHVSTDLMRWRFDTVQGTSWTLAHDVLELRLADAHARPDERLDRFRRLLDVETLSRIQLLALRQAAEDLAAVGTDGSYGKALRDLVLDHLSGIRALAIPSEHQVVSVLAALRPHIEAPEKLDRVNGLPSVNPPRISTESTTESAYPRPDLHQSGHYGTSAG
ncbi:NACHT domain-containing protein [Marinactinospora rubrisoli]|uniref:NACHT domain-containing protein n=1 Tax=Marinactinospora rubrisoli TaxID=2715399 RepID=A0ABW2KGN0_9ACTN